MSTSDSGTPRVVLDWLAQPTAEMIETRTEPPYGDPSFPMATGQMLPISTDGAAKLGLASGGRLNADYAVVQNMYRAILLPRLIDTLGLAAYDRELAGDGIVAASGDNVPFALYAQKCAGLDLQYLYIRNNLYIERLSQDQIDMFLAHADDPDFVTDPGLGQIVTDTFRRVMRQDDKDGDFQTGFDTGSFRFYNDAIVVFLTTSISPDEMDINGNFNDLYYERTALISDMLGRLRQVLPDAWSGHVSLLWWEV